MIVFVNDALIYIFASSRIMFSLFRLLSLPELTFIEPESHMVLNVGGQIFETTAGVLTRDPYSVLAACCRVNSPVKADNEGIIYFDRDWWLFRHVLSYLRSNILPNEVETLKELYREASYYRLESLQRSIEAIPVNQVTNLNANATVTSPGFLDSGVLQRSYLK
jgi:hypothetical protein